MENTNKELSVRVARTAAHHFANYLRDPGGVKFDNGDTSRNGAMAMMLFEMGKKKDGFDPDKINRFENELTVRLLSLPNIYLDVDYSPDGTISDLMNDIFGKTGWNSMNTFPVKTNLYWSESKQKLLISEGYRAEDVEIQLLD